MEIPKEIGDFSSLQELYLANNTNLNKYFTPEEMKFFKNYPSLAYLPDEIKKIQGLRILDISDDYFSKNQVNLLKKMLPGSKIIIQLITPTPTINSK